MAFSATNIVLIKSLIGLPTSDAGLIALDLVQLPTSLSHGFTPTWTTGDYTALIVAVDAHLADSSSEVQALVTPLLTQYASINGKFLQVNEGVTGKGKLIDYDEEIKRIRKAVINYLNLWAISNFAEYCNAMYGEDPHSNPSAQGNDWR